MTKHKIQNKHKIQIPKLLFWILNLFCALNFVICHLYAQEDSKLVTLAKQIIEAKDNETTYIYFEELKDVYFKENKYSEFVEFLQSIRQKKNTLEPFTNYYIALSRYSQLRYLEEKQMWDEYFNNGNGYKEELAQAIQKTIDATDALNTLNIYSRLILWQFHKDQQDAFAEAALSDLMNAVLEYSRGTQDAKPIKDIADRLMVYVEKGRSRELYKIYVSKISASDIKDDKLKDIASGFYEEGNLELSEIIYDSFIERIAKSYPKEKSIPLLIDIAKKFSYRDGAITDGLYAEKILEKIEEIGQKEAFGEELMYLRAFNLEKAKEYAKAKDVYLDLINLIPQTIHADEANFKAGIIYIYILRDIKSGRAYFEKIAHKETLSPQTISSLYQLGLLSQWENDLAKARDYYQMLIEKIKDGFPETSALAKERLRELNELKPIEYNLKTFLDLSLKEENTPFDAARLNLSSSRYKVNKNEAVGISSAPYNIDSGCMPVEIQYLWSGHLGQAKPSSEESAFDTAYVESGTKEINLVIVSPAGILERNIEIVDVF